MAVVNLSPIGNGAQYFTIGGLPANGGFLKTYQAGTTTPQPTFTTSAGNVANAVSIPLGTDGRPPAGIWLTAGVAYDFILTDSSGAQIGPPMLNISGIGDGGSLATSLADSTDVTKGATLIGYLGGTLRAYLNQFVTSAGASIVGWIQAGTGAVIRTIQAKLRDTISVKDFGAVGDGATDDTAAIQAAITAIITPNGGNLYFPSGTYKITAAINIPFSTGWKIQGASRSSTTIKQATNNTQIFKLTGDLTHSWNISDLSFDYASAQPSTNTNAIAIKMGTGTATANGIFNWQIERCKFISAFRAIAGDATNSPSIWGVHISDCWFDSSMSGAAFFANPTPSVGQPNICIENCYINSSSATEPGIFITAGDNVVIRNVEFNSGSALPQMSIGSSPMVSIIGCKSEAFAFGASSLQLWDFPNSNVIMIGVSFNGFTGTQFPRLVSAGTGGKLSINGMWATSSMTGGTAIAYVSDDVILSANIKTSGLVSTNARTYLGNVPVPRLNVDALSMNSTQTRGDESVVLTLADYRVQYFAANLTANRTLTLPNTGLVDGLEFEVVSRNTAAFTLQITDPIGVQNYTIPASTRGFTRYRAIGGSWLLMAAGTLP